MYQIKIRVLSFFLCICWMVAALLFVIPSVYAQNGIQTVEQARTNEMPHLEVMQGTDGVTFTWDISSSGIQAAHTAVLERVLSEFPMIRFGGYELPMQLEMVLLSDEVDISPRFQHIEEAVWFGPIPLAAILEPTAIDWQGAYGPPQPPPNHLPTSPLFVLREGRARGQRIAIVAFSPIYEANGSVKIVHSLGALMSGASIASDEVTSSAFPYKNDPVNRSPLTSAPEPANDAATQQSFKVYVSQAGIQQLTGGMLMEKGLAAGTALSKLHLSAMGRQIALDIYDADLLLDATTMLRFYAKPAAHSMTVGDRWNRTETYWLTVETTDGLRMGTKGFYPSGAPLRDTAFEYGIWEENRLYESTMSGIDGDYWFAQKLDVSPGQLGDVTSYPIYEVVLQNKLPLATSPAYTSVFTLTGSAHTVADHSLHVDLGILDETINWSSGENFEDWQQTITTPVRPSNLIFTLLPTSRPSSIRLDKVYWKQPVHLDFGGQGGRFTGVEGRWIYQLTNTPAGRAVYDVTDPYNPKRLQVAEGPDFVFEDGPEARKYIVSGPSTLYTPSLVPHNPVVFSAATGADAIYIAPAHFMDELAPLIAHRQNQGYQVAAVPVQHIYDTWGYGQISPHAIRDFLRYAVHNWQPRPISAVLVGDATVDPHNYLGKQDGVYNTDIIPAYLADIDPWIGETACENCFAQLDGDDPLESDEDPDFLIDIWVGRLSVQDEEQLNAVINKILRYENGQDRGLKDTWRQTSLYVADNYHRANGTTDEAGNFPHLSDIVFLGDPRRGLDAVQDPGMLVERLYYDPRPRNPATPWREPDGEQARLRTIQLLQKGPGLVSFNGHSNHFQWASTDTSLANPYLFGTNDIFALQNIDRLSIVLEMTCFTGQFTQVSRSGTTMDERFLRHADGGAVAVWGSSGLTVAYGHDGLMRGFQEKLWSMPPFTARLGELVEAGYMELFRKRGCCQEARMDYLLLGDPLTPALIWAPQRYYLPVVR